MEERTYIDEIDIYTEFGVWITEGGYNGLITFPPLKKPDTNDWQEEDGIEVDLSAPVLDSREFTITFAATNAPNLAGLISLLSDGAYHIFNLTEIGQTFILRLVSQTNYQLFQGAEYFTLTFADDFPLREYEYLAPEATTVFQTGYTLDAKPLSDYGIWVLDGTEAELRKTPAVKKNLLRNTADESGAYYDWDAVTYRAKDVTMHLSMVAGSLEVFWQNYKALLFDLSKAGPRLIYSEGQDETRPYYYSSSSVSNFNPIGGKVWCDFTLTLVAYRNEAVEPVIIPKEVKYGYLYNWYTVLSSKEIAPVGWHVATFSELALLVQAITVNSIEAPIFKEIGTLHWNMTGTDNYGFKYRGGGIRSSTLGFEKLKVYNAQWLKEYPFANNGIFEIAELGPYTYYAIGSKNLPYATGCYIRMVKDDNTWVAGDKMIGNDGHEYPTIKVNNKVWITESIVETKYRDGSQIPEVTDNAEWAALTTGARCSYNNDESNAFI